MFLFRNQIRNYINLIRYEGNEVLCRNYGIKSLNQQHNQLERDGEKEERIKERRGKERKKVRQEEKREREREAREEDRSHVRGRLKVEPKMFLKFYHVEHGKNEVVKLAA